MERTMTTLILALLLGIALALPACGGGNGDDGGGGDTAVLEIRTVPSKAAYAAGEEIILDVIVKNVSSGDLTLATVDEALEVMTLTRDGVAVPATTRTLKSELDLTQNVEDSKTVVSPNGEITIRFVTGHNGTGQVLSTYGEGATDLETKDYFVGTAGAYSAGFFYRAAVGVFDTRVIEGSFTVAP